MNSFCTALLVQLLEAYSVLPAFTRVFLRIPSLSNSTQVESWANNKTGVLGEPVTVSRPCDWRAKTQTFLDVPETITAVLSVRCRQLLTVTAEAGLIRSMQLPCRDAPDNAARSRSPIFVFCSIKSARSVIIDVVEYADEITPISTTVSIPVIIIATAMSTKPTEPRSLRAILTIVGCCITAVRYKRFELSRHW